MTKRKFRVENLNCANCAAKIEDKINKIDGVESATLQFLTEQLIVESNLEDWTKLIKKIKKAGRKVEPDCVITEVEIVDDKL